MRAGVYGLGLACLLGAGALGIYSAVAVKPDCAGFYTCVRVVDRTNLLGWTVTAVAVAVFVVLLLLRSVVRVVPGWLPWLIRAGLGLVAIGLAACYQVTRFASLRSAMMEVMHVPPSMWTASAAVWLAVPGLALTAVGFTNTAARRN